MQQFSSTTYFPIIIDSPNQQDQDIENIDKIFKFIDRHQPNDSQMILGLAETYDIDFSCKTITLNHKYSLLQEDEYEEVCSELNDKLYEMWQ